MTGRPTFAQTPGRAAKAPGRALRLHGTIARKLGISILSGEYKPGDLLDSEIAASEQFAVSRTAYREAVRILAAKGLVDARPKVGTRINPQSKWNLLDPDVGVDPTKSNWQSFTTRRKFSLMASASAPGAILTST